MATSPQFSRTSGISLYIVANKQRYDNERGYEFGRMQQPFGGGQQRQKKFFKGGDGEC